MRIYVDADACPVKEEAYKVARRYALPVKLVANAWINAPREVSIYRHEVFERIEEEESAERDSDEMFGRYLEAGARMAMGTDCAPHNLIEEMRLAMRQPPQHPIQNIPSLQIPMASHYLRQRHKLTRPPRRVRQPLHWDRCRRRRRPTTA